jgi:hypothetical protein
LFDDRSAADISGMNNTIHATEMTHNRRVEEAMGISDDAKTDRP